MHTLITGNIGAGKGTLMDKLVQARVIPKRYHPLESGLLSTEILTKENFDEYNKVYYEQRLALEYHYNNYKHAKVQERSPFCSLFVHCAALTQIGSM